MSQRLDVNISDLSDYPDWDVWIAANLRGLLRARNSNDRIGQWLATNGFCSIFCQILKDVLNREPSWDSENRWIDCLDQRELTLNSTNRVHVSGVIWWNSHANTERGGYEPLEADLVFSEGESKLINYTIRFGDRRGPRSGGQEESSARWRAEVTAGTVEWDMVIHNDRESVSA
jgi:hypothetical protein